MRGWTLGGLVVLVIGCQASETGSLQQEGQAVVEMSVMWEVAPGVHPQADSLGDISGVAVDGDGNVYASDRLAAVIWVFDAEGQFQFGFGGKGDGPGEFEAPSGPAVGPNGRLYVRDAYRVTVFGKDEATGLLSQFESVFEGPLYPDYLSNRTTRFGADGTLYYPGKRWDEDGTFTSFMLRYTSDGLLMDTLFIPTYANAPPLTALYRTGTRGVRTLRGLNYVPMTALPTWDITTSGTIITGDALSYRLTEFSEDGTALAVFERNIPAGLIPDEERNDSLQALRGRIDEIEVPLARVEGMPDEVSNLEIPHTYPAYMAVYSSANGEVWVRRWPIGGGDQTIFDVFASAGSFARTVRLPRAISIEPTPYLSPTSVVAVSLDPETGESIILRFTTDGPG